jgi:hypothetical protein
MEIDRPREQVHLFNNPAEIHTRRHEQFEQQIPVKFPRTSPPDRWKAWFELMDR